MNTITRQQIDDAFLAASKQYTENFSEQFLKLLDVVPEQGTNPISCAMLAGSIAQANAIATMKEVCYSLFLSES